MKKTRLVNDGIVHIQKRDKDHDFLMEIRNGKYITENNDVLPEFFDIVNEYEKRLQYAAKNTSLPDKPDYKKIRELVMDINQKVIDDHRDLQIDDEEEEVR